MNKTTILPDDANHAELKFNELIAENKILFVVLGDGTAPAALVAKADNMSGEPHEPRWVVWAKTPNHIAGTVSQLDCGVASPPQFEPPDRAFTTALSDTIRDVIRADEPEPDNVRVFEAYANAET